MNRPLLTLILLAAFTMAVGYTVRNSEDYTAGKEIADSAAVEPDTLTGRAFGPQRPDSIRFWIVPDSSLVYTIQVSPADSSNWHTIVLDTVAAGSLEVRAIAAHYPHDWLFRLIIDNLGTDTTFVKTEVAWEW